MAVLRMIDVGDAQGEVEWDFVARAGVAVAYVKCTEGTDFVAKTFTAARVKALRAARGPRTALHPRGAPLKWGPYHYLRFRRDRSGAEEARHAVKTARAAGWRPGRRGVAFRRDLPMCVDTERGSNERELQAMTGRAALRYVEQFTDEVRRLTGRGCLTYLSPGFAAELGFRAPRNGRHAWVADWDAPDGRPNVPKGFSRRRALVHQTSDAGTCPGVRGHVDTDLFLGGWARLLAYVGGIEVPGRKRPHAPDAPAPMTTQRVQLFLRRCGWPIKVDGKRGEQTRQAIRDFQRGYARRHLRVDALVGPATAAALAWSAEHDGRCSEHFRFKEFASSRTGWIKTHRALVLGLEELRRRTGPIGVLSGFRDFDLGATKSQHRYGNAIDPTRRLPLADCRAVGAFSGIGLLPGAPSASSVRHLDVRHVGPNFTGGTPHNPTVFADTF